LTAPSAAVRGFLLTAVLALAAMCATSSAAQSLERAERPEIRVGDLWVFQNTDLRTGEKKDTSFLVTALTGDEIMMETGGSTSGAWTFTREWNPVERKAGDVVTDVLKPDWPYLRFPMALGKTWEVPFEIEATSRFEKHVAEWQWKAQVVAVETVTVRAGTFQTFRIDYEGSFTTRSGRETWTGSHGETAWYAPAAKAIVKREFTQLAPARNVKEHHTIELLSFKLAP
jgi:hypothetical protein